MRDLKRVLVVESDQAHGTWVTDVLRRLGCTVTCVPGVQRAMEWMQGQQVDLVLCEQLLPDGSARDVLNAMLKLTPIPLMITMSRTACRQEVFRMGRAGVAGYLEKPFTVEQLSASLLEARHYRVDLPMLAASLVGAQPVGDVATELREAMTRQAMALARGNQTRAARFLGVHRQALAKTWKRVAPAGERPRRLAQRAGI
jgi:DNA-binding NtrC family response regulator